MARKTKAERIRESLPELARMTPAQLNDPTEKMSPAFFETVLREFLGEDSGKGEVFFEAKAFDKALTEAGYWNWRERTYAERHDHASAMLEYLKMNRRAARSTRRRRVSLRVGHVTHSPRASKLIQ